MNNMISGMEDRTDRYGDGYEESAGSALLNLFLFSGLMFTLPIAAFFVSKQLLEEHYQLEPPYNQLAPAIFSIVLVNVIIMLYVCRAFRIDRKEREAAAALGNARDGPVEQRKKKE